jgi:hypothetical protein
MNGTATIQNTVVVQGRDQFGNKLWSTTSQTLTGMYASYFPLRDCDVVIALSCIYYGSSG